MSRPCWSTRWVRRAAGAHAADGPGTASRLELAIDSGKVACLTDVFVVLTEVLPKAVQHDLGVRDRRTGQVITVHQVRRLLDGIKCRFDPGSDSGYECSELRS